MTPQMQENEMQQSEQAPPLVEERRWMKPLLRILSIAVPLVGGFLVWTTLDWLLLMILLWVFVGALLFRSWWALLVVPLVFAGGVILGAVLLPLMYGGWPALQTRVVEHFEPLDIIVTIGTPSVILGTTLGTLLGVKMKRTAQAPSPANEKPRLLPHREK